MRRLNTFLPALLVLFFLTACGESGSETSRSFSGSSNSPGADSGTSGSSGDSFSSSGDDNGTSGSSGDSSASPGNDSGTSASSGDSSASPGDDSDASGSSDDSFSSSGDDSETSDSSSGTFSSPGDSCVAEPEIEQADYYVAPGGDDNNPGSEKAPFATAQKAQSMAQPGDLIYFRKGTYYFNDLSTDIGVLFDKSGTEGKPIRYWAYPGEVPVFDFYQLVPQARIRGFSVQANWLHFKGLELRGVQQILKNVNESWGIRVEKGASHNIFEQLNLHHNEGPGLFIADGGYNLVLNVDSHHNYDPDRGGENADGFGCHSNDPGNVFRGSRAWYNSDDGFDFIFSPAACVVEYSMAFYNGYIPDTDTAAGNGSGIKAGGFGLDSSRFPEVIPRHVVRYNISAGNRASGFYANHHPGAIEWIHNTAFNNPKNFDMLADQGMANHYLRNNLAVSPGIALSNATAADIDSKFNSWDLNLNSSAGDFESTDIADALGARLADGSLPAPVFLYPKEDSSVRGAGGAVPGASNSTPDLGAYQYGSESTCTRE